MNAEEISSSIITASPQQAGQLVDVVVRAFISDRRAARLRRPLMSAIDVMDGARSQQRVALGWSLRSESHQGALDMQITTIGLDIAKNVFQVHGIDATEKVVVRKNFAAARCWRFSKRWRHVLSAWRLAPRRIIGRAS